MKTEVRKLPKKTKGIIAFLTILAIIAFLIITYLKEQKIAEILNSLGYTNIEKVTVINKMSVENKENRKKSTVYKIMFLDKSQNKECIGFLHKKNEKDYIEDFDCK